MKRQSAGTVLYRTVSGRVEVLIVHPAGPYNRNARWSFPKGGIEDGETPEAAARRETWEETGVTVVGELFPLGHVDYRRSRKRVFGFAGRADDGACPRCASWEVDRAEFVDLQRARELLHPDQAEFLDRLIDHLGGAGGSAAAGG
jgi:predicted NUDIX family NTP pyrophosphohydrolase